MGQNFNHIRPSCDLGEPVSLTAKVKVLPPASAAEPSDNESGQFRG